MMQPAVQPLARALPPATLPQKLVTFRVGMQLFALPLGLIAGAQRDFVVTHVPLAPTGLALAWHDEKPISVLDLRTCFALPPRHTAPAVLVVSHEGEKLALLTDRIEEVIDAAPTDFAPTPVTMEPVWQRLTNGVVQHAGGLIAMLSIGGALTALRA